LAPLSAAATPSRRSGRRRAAARSPPYELDILEDVIQEVDPISDPFNDGLFALKY
jgi:hypothetical protein